MKHLKPLLMGAVMGMSFTQHYAAAGMPVEETVASSGTYTAELKGNSTGRYTQQLEENLFFTMTPITPKNAASWGDWGESVRDFFSPREVEYATEFPKSLRNCSGGACEIRGRAIYNFIHSNVSSAEKRLWMATFSYEPLKGEEGMLLEEDKRNVEMAVSISSDKHAPVAVHVGIFRNPFAHLEREPYSYRSLTWLDSRGKDKMHPNLSMKLHQLAAKTVADFRRLQGWEPVRFFMSTPVKTMQEIILKNMPKGTVHMEQEYWNKDFLKLSAQYECKPAVYERVRDEDYNLVRFTLKGNEEAVIWDVEGTNPHSWIVSTAFTAGGPLMLIDYEALQAEPKAESAVPESVPAAGAAAGSAEGSS